LARAGFRFEQFELLPGDRRLLREGTTVELSSRYFDALALLVREQGRLVSKDRFLDEVWKGVPVTDEALTQCIRTLRKQLGDDAANPRFIETAPKHGYRFIATVAAFDGERSAPAAKDDVEAGAWRRFWLTAAAATAGGTVAGAVGGLFYGFALQNGMGAISVLLVLICITAAIGLAGGAGVGLGIGAAGFLRGRPALWSTLGGAAGGLVVGALVKLVGLDAFNLLFGTAPGDITGAPEGVLLGGAVGLAVWLAGRLSARRAVAAGALAGGVAGMVIALVGGRLMAGSLALLVGRFPQSRLDLDQLGGLFGEGALGPVSLVIASGLEGALFAAGVVGATLLARRRYQA
jgi:DNA-binding winged helix-turn-helix (wHTH) protein